MAKREIDKMRKKIRAICFVALAIVILTCSLLMAAKPFFLEVPKVTKDKVICFAVYTVHNNILKMTAQLYPLDDADPRTVRLQIRRDGTWAQIAEGDVIEKGWIATFRVENWDPSRDIQYRLAHDTYTINVGHGPSRKSLTGIKAIDPSDNKTLTIVF